MRKRNKGCAIVVKHCRQDLRVRVSASIALWHTGEETGRGISRRRECLQRVKRVLGSAVAQFVQIYILIDTDLSQQSIYGNRDDLDVILGLLLVDPSVLNLMYHIQALYSSTKDRMFAIKPRLF